MAQIASESEQAAYAAPAVANPAALGLSGFALTTFVLSTINAGWFPLTILPIVVGLAFFYGGLAQLLAGMWEFRSGNTFGATAFTSYGAFWLSFAAIFMPGFGIAAKIPPSLLNPAIGIYLIGWTIFTVLMFLGTLRSNMALILVFGVLILTFLLLGLGFLGLGTILIVIGGYLGIILALLAWYTALAGVLASMKAPFQLPVGPMS